MAWTGYWDCWRSVTTSNWRSLLSDTTLLPGSFLRAYREAFGVDPVGSGRLAFLLHPEKGQCVEQHQGGRFGVRDPL